MNTPYMIRYVYYYILFLFAKIMQVFQLRQSPVEIIKQKTPVEIYMDSYTQKFLKTFVLTDALLESSDAVLEHKQYSQNIDKIVYSRKELLEILKDPKNDLEKKWSSNILFETTPRGNIVMHYDIFKQGFAYYADQQVTYNILNVAAMKYCLMFGCRDFFVDEKILTEENKSPFIQIQLDEEKEENDKKKDKVRELMPELKNAPLAKFKNYSNKPVDESKQSNESVDDTKPSDKKPSDKKPSDKKLDLFVNRFIYMGKMANFSFLQKIPMKKTAIKNATTTTNTQYDGMFGDVVLEKMSYKDFKALNVGKATTPSL